MGFIHLLTRVLVGETFTQHIGLASIIFSLLVIQSLSLSMCLDLDLAQYVAGSKIWSSKVILVQNVLI